MTTQHFAGIDPMSSYTMDQIEILPVSLLDENRQMVNELNKRLKHWGLNLAGIIYST